MLVMNLRMENLLLPVGGVHQHMVSIVSEPSALFEFKKKLQKDSILIE